MRENRMCGSEGGEPGSTRLPYPYRRVNLFLPLALQASRDGYTCGRGRGIGCRNCASLFRPTSLNHGVQTLWKNPCSAQVKNHCCRFSARLSKSSVISATCSIASPMVAPSSSTDSKAC